MTVRFTHNAFVRSHGNKPSRTAAGTWAFQRTSTETAFDADLRGEILWSEGLLTLAEAKQQVAAQVDDGTLLAVLP